MPRNYEIPEYKTLLEFQEVYLQAIAMAWKDSDFADRLTKNPEETLNNTFGYRCPWSVKLKVSPAPEEDDNGSQYGWQNTGDSKVGQWNLPKTKIRIGLPEKPKPAVEQPLALTSYNSAGPTYLFTCC